VAGDGDQEVRARLLAWQWSDYSAKHRDRGNLLLHIVVVPLFQLGTLALIYAAVAGRLGVVVLGVAAMVASIVAQGRGHRRERETPAPFSGTDDVVTRLLVEQWVTFPRFVLSGQWYRNLRGGRT
jgi:phage terminase small subunit